MIGSCRNWGNNFEKGHTPRRNQGSLLTRSGFGGMYQDVGEFESSVLRLELLDQRIGLPAACRETTHTSIVAKTAARRYVSDRAGCFRFGASRDLVVNRLGVVC